MVYINDFNLDIDGIDEILNDGLLESKMKLKNQTVIASNESVITSKVMIPQLENILLHNATITPVINSYLGPLTLNGCKITKSTKKFHSIDQYLASYYHHEPRKHRICAADILAHYNVARSNLFFHSNLFSEYTI